MMFRGFTIGKKLTVGFGIVLVLVLLVGVVGAIGILTVRGTVQDNLDTGFQINELSLKAQTEMLNARRREKDFLLRYETEGFDAAKAAYGDQVPKHVAILKSDLESIIKLLETKGQTTEVAQVKALLN